MNEDLGSKTEEEVYLKYLIIAAAAAVGVLYFQHIRKDQEEDKKINYKIQT